jgi:cold shock protein
MFEYRGIVKRFSNRKGYGFLVRDDGGPEVFVHYSAIQTETHKGLKKGAAVRFSIVEGLKGQRAEWVLSLGERKQCPCYANSQHLH